MSERSNLKRVYLTTPELVAAEKALEFLVDYKATYRPRVNQEGMAYIKRAHTMFKNFVRANEKGLLPPPPELEKLSYRGRIDRDRWRYISGVLGGAVGGVLVGLGGAGILFTLVN